MADARRQEIAKNIADAIQQVEKSKKASTAARLVAVSKYKPAEDIQFAFDANQRHFGENYVQELVEKSNQLPRDIQWHFIGTLQSNKCKTVAEIPNLFAVETIDSAAKADKLNKACESVKRPNRLGVFVQVNTSAEEAKGGIAPEESTDVCKHIVEKCSQLNLLGLMTIGKFGRDPNQENPDFKCLVECKEKVDRELRVNLELSMGMSDDYIQALQAGSTNVRVGRSIFGSRPPKTT